MYEMLFFFGAIYGNCIAITNATRLNVNSGVIPSNITFAYRADTIIVFQKGEFHSVTKCRYKSTDTLSEEMKGQTIETVVSKLQHYKLGFIIDTEIEILGKFSKPYIVYSALKEEYYIQNQEAIMERLSR